MAAAINILFRGKYGWGFPVGSFRSCFFVFNGGFTKQPQPGSSIPLTMGALGPLYKLCRGRVGCSLLMCSG